MAAQGLGRFIPWQWVLYWLVTPNLLIMAMWPIGGPSMDQQLLLFGLLAMVISQLPWIWPKRFLLLAMMCLIMAFYLCVAFNLPIWAIRHLPEFMGEVKAWRDPLYLGGGLAFLALVVFVLRRAPAVPRFASIGPMLVAFASVFGLSLLDNAATASTSDSYHAQPGVNDPFHAATDVAGLHNPPADRRHLIVVLVEAMGQPAADAERGIFDAGWNRPGWRARYDVEHGSIPYYGSTTSAELRELCGQWGDFTQFDFAHADCLPRRYKAAGYETTAMHSFVGNFFQREQWYPQMFDHAEFAPDLIGQGVKSCGGMFPGACDSDVPRMLAARLKQADKPQLIYWLTLNSHMPVVADASLQTATCPIGTEQWRTEFPQICRVMLVQQHLADAIDALAMDPDLPPTDILIVGDHMPPYFQRASRVRFNGSQVPWIMLRSKAEKAVPAIAG